MKGVDLDVEAEDDAAVLGAVVGGVGIGVVRVGGGCGGGGTGSFAWWQWLCTAVVFVLVGFVDVYLCIFTRGSEDDGFRVRV